ncbi:cytochrome P450 [Kineococcus glutinatus]|uniref:Cytochrome P450 n=1 Tax=Kineococcus glutinatus TaxID=1070872 RepID=A0ABP9I0V0_9ACTN
MPRRSTPPAPPAPEGVGRGAAGTPNRYSPLAAPGPTPWEMVRAVPAIRRSAVDFLTGVAARHGDLAAFPLPRTPVLLLNDPEGARHVLVDNHRGYGRATLQYRALSAVTGQGLLTSDGEAWRTSRRAVQPAFHHTGLHRVAAHAAAAAERVRGEWAALPAGAVHDVAPGLFRAALEVVGPTLADEDLSDVGQRLVDAVGTALEAAAAQAAGPVPAAWPTPARRRLRRAVAVIDEACEQVVRARRARGLRPGDDDVLALLLAAGTPPRQVRDELVTFVVAGHETVASCLTWTLHLLARHPAAQRVLHAELDAVLGPPGSSRVPGFDDLPALRHTRAVVEESLRLYPPAWVVTRTALADDVVAGLPVPAGTLVIVCTWALHRHPGAWEAPEEFRPERFPAAARNPAYLPFGAGPRLCVGRDLALLEAVVALAALLREHRLEPAPGPAPRVESLVTLRPAGGMPLRIARRDVG